ncbi:hypothetical protein [Mycoplasma sp. P36-A1]|uniref:hypothetical protein n=1 Tax=Mycoplasma sp. P36-A1 TaxID=3252900 RepID=UPI003C2F9826
MYINRKEQNTISVHKFDIYNSLLYNVLSKSYIEIGEFLMKRTGLYVLLGISIACIILLRTNINSNEIYYATNKLYENSYIAVDAMEHEIIIDAEDFNEKCVEESEYYKLQVNSKLEIIDCISWNRNEIPKRVQDLLDDLNLE